MHPRRAGISAILRSYLDLRGADRSPLPAQRFRLAPHPAIFDDAKVKPGAKIVIFHTADVPEGYSSLDLSYIRDNNIIIALKLNDITLPPERGFPFQVVAESKFGYKWAKWITRIEISDNTSFRGFWEGYGYNNNADINGPAFEQ